MSPAFDPASVERAVAGLRWRWPRGPHRGAVGHTRSASVGSAVELHDFRTYQPGDDLRHVDWNAVARTGDLVLRIREEEVAPRIEVILDVSASMAVSAEKAKLAREVAYAATLLARHGDWAPTLVCAGQKTPPTSAVHDVLAALSATAFDERTPLPTALSTSGFKKCGVRVLVSDLLVEAPPATVVDRLARGAAQLVVLQVLASEDVDPSGFVGGTRLTDAETGEAVDRTLREDDVARYRRRLGQHVAGWQDAVTRVHGALAQLDTTQPFERLVRGPLALLLEPAA